MLRSSFLWRLYAAYVVLILITIGTVGFLTGRRIERDTMREIHRSLETVAILLQEIATPALGTQVDPAFQPHVARLGAEVGTRLTVIRADGLVIADSDEEPAHLDNHGERPEVLEARSRGVGSASRFSDSTRQRMQYLALAVRPGGTLLGYVRTSLPLTEIEVRMRHLWLIVAMSGAVAALIALPVGYLLARRMVRPLQTMTRVARSLAAGDEGQHIHLHGPDEIGQLAVAFNTMSSELTDRMTTITRDRNRLRAILGSMVEGVVAVDAEERLVHLNRVAARLLDAPPGDRTGRKIWEVTRRQEICQALARAIETGATQAGEITVHTPTGDQTIEFQVAPLRDGATDRARRIDPAGPTDRPEPTDRAGAQRSAGAVVVLHDITELRRLETMRRDFVANVSHELKTPLTAIRGLTETMIADRDMPEETRQRFTTRITAQTERLSALVTDLLALSRLESDHQALAVEPLDLSALARQRFAARRQLDLMEERGLELIQEISPDALMVDGDREALGRLIDNLLDNAIQYTPPGGQVRLILTTDAGAALIEVADSGIGIEPRHQERIFERFYREDPARSRSHGGTGLGLSIVKHTALAHGGRVAVESMPGQGSTFRIWLPLGPSEPAAG